MMAANAVQNMALAHEISVNQNFKLEKLEYTSNRYFFLLKFNLHFKNIKFK
jgi:hypothetical protein